MTAPYVVRELDLADTAAWDAFVDACPEATFFHRAGWRTVVERSFGHRTHYLYAMRGDTITGVLPLIEVKSLLFGHALISNAFCMGGGTAVTEEAARIVLDDRAAALLKSTGAAYLEYRQPAKLKDDWQTRNDLYANFSGPLCVDEAENLKQIPRKERAVIRKAMDLKSTCDVENDPDAIHALYAFTVHNLGTPVFSKKYFRNLLEVFGKECNVLTLRVDGALTASVLSFYFKDRVMPYYMGAEAASRRLGGIDLLLWRLMRHAVSRGHTVFDFGRSKIGTGPYDFKKNWGFAPSPITHQFLMRPGTEMPNINPLNPKYRMMIDTWKRLPLSVANRIGPFIVRNIG